MKAGELRIEGTLVDSHWSPVAIEQSWVSSHMFGVMKPYEGVLATEPRSAASCV